MPKSNHSSIVIRRRWWIVLCWFVPALTAFVHAALLMAQQSPVIRATAPLRQVAIEKVLWYGNTVVNRATMKGEITFVNEGRALLKVQVRQRPSGGVAPYHIHVFRDEEHYDYMLSLMNETCWLSEGKHVYRIVVKKDEMPSYDNPGPYEMRILVDTPSRSLEWLGLGTLSLTFLMIGRYHLNRVSGR